jgi:hypothetical protein
MAGITEDERTARATGQLVGTGILAVLLVATMGVLATLVAIALHAMFSLEVLGG